MWSITSKGYVFEISVVGKLLLIAIVLLALSSFFIYKEKQTKAKKIIKFSSGFTLLDLKKIYLTLALICEIACISLIPLTFVADNRLQYVEWNYSDPITYEIVLLKDNDLLLQETIVKRKYSYQKSYYHYFIKDSNENLIYDKVPTNNTNLYSSDNYRIEKYNMSRNWLLWDQTDTCNKIYLPEDIIKEIIN